MQFKRDSSGLYLDVAADHANARVAFLFQDQNQTPPNFDLTAASWAGTVGWLAFFVPDSASSRDWDTFAAGLRAAFAATQNPAPQVGWFAEPLAPATTTIVPFDQGTPPTLSQSFNLAFRNTTCIVTPQQFGGTTSVAFDEASNSLIFSALQSVQLSVTLPQGGGITLPDDDRLPAVTGLSIPLSGAQAGVAAFAIQISPATLPQFETGMMYFSAVEAGVVSALNYPAIRAPIGSSSPFNFNVSLDVLQPVAPDRSFFQFTDTLLGSYFVTATGKPFAFNTANGADISKWSRLVFAGRPLSDAADSRFYYLTPAGRFGLTIDPGTPGATVQPSVAQLLCGVTGTEFLSVNLGTDALEFLPGSAAWKIPVDPDSTAPVYLDCTATTSWAQVVTSSGAYVSQPERSPLYQQPSPPKADAGPAPPPPLAYVLGFKATDTWSPDGGGSGPAAPMVAYAGLDFVSNPNLKLTQYLAMEAGALNPARGHAYVAPGMAGRKARAMASDDPSNLAMTPQGMLVGLQNGVWNLLQIAISDATPPILQFDSMGPAIQRAVQKNQIFTVVSVNPANPGTGRDPTTPLFTFDNRYLEIADWTFDLSPAGLAAPDNTPPIFIMKFYPGKSIADLAGNVSLWSDPTTFNADPKTIQSYLAGVIARAQADVDKHGEDSLYANFCKIVTDQNFSGVLVVNCNMRLDLLPPAIRAVLGGMKDPGIAAFRVHHVGISINDINPGQPTPQLAQSAMFGLVDYEGVQVDVPADQLYDFQVEYLRALFLNSELRTFECKVNLTVNNLFKTVVTLQPDGGGIQPAKNIIAIMGSYQAHKTSGDQTTSGQGAYSFVAKGNFSFDFGKNSYLQSISLTKLQFSFDQEVQGAVVDHGTYTSSTSTIKAHFGIWGSIKFNNLNVLDIFSFDKLVFSDLGINAVFDLTINTRNKDSDPSPPQPSTTVPGLTFAPGNLRLDLGATKQRSGADSMLKLLPFKLKSFLYSENADESIESLNYYSLGTVAGLSENGIAPPQNYFNYALLFDLDLGSMGGLVGSLSAFKFSVLIGWLAGENGGIAFGIQLPQVDGKLEIKIEGVLTISIEQFNLEYATDPPPSMLVLGMHNCYIEILGKRLPPEGTISIGLFAPSAGAAQIGWIGAFNKGEDGGGGGKDAGKNAPKLIAADGSGKTFDLDYLGVGQRVGPDPKKPPSDFEGFLKFMQKDFWDKLKAKKYADIYHPDGKWIIITHFTLLEKIEIGFVFYDVTPFYSLMLKIVAGDSFKGFEFEITYTKVTDTIGLFAAKIALPDRLRTFEVGAASVTMPTIGVDVYTNGNWKLDLGFPDGDNWSVCFRVQAMAGPIPVTGSGGFYLASLSSATDPDVFVGKDYSSILAFGLAARLGVGKDFTAGPLKAGVSLTFFGIIQGAVGYLNGGSVDLFTKQPDALSLKGQFGLIGEIYGSIDFVIIKASVNVRLQASVGIVLMFEPHVKGGSDGSVMLYVEASVSVSVTVSIDCGLFSIDISFSYDATFRFDWQLAGQKSDAHARLMYVAQIAAIGPRLAAPQAAPVLYGNLPGALPLTLLTEFTVVFPDATATGAPWLVTSLAIPYDNAPNPTPGYADFKPFEAVTTQLATFALMHALNLPAYNSVVPLGGPGNPFGLWDIDRLPDQLTGWIDYPTLLGQLALFQGTVQIPKKNANDPNGTVYYATTFPMPPFLTLATKGRLDPNGAPDFGYQFSDKNRVSADYLKAVDEYFNKMFVNQTSESSHQQMLAARAAEDSNTPLGQEIFLDFFKGLIRGAVHELLVTLQKSGNNQAPLDTLFIGAVGAQRFRALAGQMASTLRGGVRLPSTSGLTVPDGPKVLPPTNPLFALLWQEFPVGGFANKANYTVTLSNTDGGQQWLKPGNATFTITSGNDDGTNGVYGVKPWQNLHESEVAKPSAPTPIPLTQTGPQSFAFQNPIVWTPPAGAAMSLRPFPPNLVRLQIAQGASFEVKVKSRPTGGAYLPQGTPVPPADINFATTVDLKIKQIPAGKGSFLKDVYALSGASQADEMLLGQILAVLKPPSEARPIAAIQILYSPDPGKPGLVSAEVNAADVFVLRTNTTSVSQPPQGLTAMALPPPDGVAVGADLDLTSDGGYGFLQIIQQATVTNAPGYYLRYIDKAGNSLDHLFEKGDQATVTLVLTYAAGIGTSALQNPSYPIAPYYNTIVLKNLTDEQLKLLYYAETVAPALDTRYAALAAGTAGIELSRPDSVMHLKPSTALAAAAQTADVAAPTRTHMIKALTAAGVTDPDHIRRLVLESGAVPAALNALYSIVTYQIQKSDPGFVQSNLSAPLQPQKPTSGDTTGTYRIVAPLYSVATANIGVQTPDRYASIGDQFGLSVFVNDAFGNQLPTPIDYSSINRYFDPILPIDQWQGIVPTYDFATKQAGIVSLHLTPSQAAFADMSQAQKDAALVLFGTIQDQITGPGISFNIETNLALQADNASLVSIPVSAADAKNVLAMVAGVIAWLSGNNANFPAAVDISAAVSGPGALPPLFDISVLFGIERDASLVSPELRDIFPPAQMVATTVVPGIVPMNAGGGNGNGSKPDYMGIFAADFMAAFPAMKLALGMNGATAPAQQSRTGLARKRLKAMGAAGDGTGGSRGGEQSIWAVAASMVDVSIGAGSGTGPRFLSPKPLDNTLNSDTVPLPAIDPVLGSLATQQLFLDVDLDQMNRLFFQAVDNVLSPESAAKAFEIDPTHSAYDTIVRGRETLAQKYANFEVDWLFEAGSPFTGDGSQGQEAVDAFEQQMRAALMTAYSVDTIVQYDVAWNNPVSAAADGYIELFGNVEAAFDGTYTVSGTDLIATTPTPHGLSLVDTVNLYMMFTADAGQSPPPNGIYQAIGIDALTFKVKDIPSGSGTGRFDATLQNSGLSTAHVAVNSQGPSPLTFLYGNPDVAAAATVSFNLRYNVTNLQFFLVPDSGTPGAARPSIWLQLVNPVQPHIGPQGALTTIPVVFRQYPASPTVVGHSFATPAVAGSAANPLAEHSVWDYIFTYQAMLAAQDQVNSAITYNTDLRPPSNGNQSLALDAETHYSLFKALARFSAVYTLIQPILAKGDGSATWAAAIQAFANCVDEVAGNTDWMYVPETDASGPLVKVTDKYVTTDRYSAPTTRLITLQWPARQGQSSFTNVTLSVQALDPQAAGFPQAASAYPDQGPLQNPPPNSSQFQVLNVQPDAVAVTHRVVVDGLNLLAAENAIAAIQIERNLITLKASDGTPYQVVPEFVYTTSEVRPSQPVTPYIDNEPVFNSQTFKWENYIDVASLPNPGGGSACPASPSSLCQRIYSIMSDLLADPVQSASLLKAHAAAGVTSGTVRRVKVACSYRFPAPAVAGGGDTSINPLVPVVLARSFDIDGQAPDKLGEFAVLFANAIVGWAQNNGIVFGSQSTAPAGAALIFDVTLYAGLSGGNVPVLRFANLQLFLTDVDPQ